MSQLQYRVAIDRSGRTTATGYPTTRFAHLTFVTNKSASLESIEFDALGGVRHMATSLGH
ncbi:uncharacterized protein N7500_009063 [Penicillium coprophilum]|uniref:uncharacterized protein n=1 Tax=Penicillium coprophilum TaxID=36646 RepID=UPI00239DFA9D|nr:uncharacterized protein N7500_009063 [Penicillium coprophilum]KAJ5153624.1 hypothetical protein N7500_009063 [Penicillium coprophilum]